MASRDRVRLPWTSAGARLEATEAPMDTFVIDHIERPTGNRSPTPRAASLDFFYYVIVVIAIG